MSSYRWNRVQNSFSFDCWCRKFLNGKMIVLELDSCDAKRKKRTKFASVKLWIKEIKVGWTENEIEWKSVSWTCVTLLHLTFFYQFHQYHQHRCVCVCVQWSPAKLSFRWKFSVTLIIMVVEFLPSSYSIDRKIKTMKLFLFRFQTFLLRSIINHENMIDFISFCIRFLFHSFISTLVYCFIYRKTLIIWTYEMKWMNENRIHKFELDCNQCNHWKDEKSVHKSDI